MRVKNVKFFLSIEKVNPFFFFLSNDINSGLIIIAMIIVSSKKSIKVWNTFIHVTCIKRRKKINMKYLFIRFNCTYYMIEWMVIWSIITTATTKVIISIIYISVIWVFIPPLLLLLLNYITYNFIFFRVYFKRFGQHSDPIIIIIVTSN